MSNYFISASTPRASMPYERVFLIHTGPQGYSIVEMMFNNNRGTETVTLRSDGK